MSDYDALRALGHSAAKAVEIILDAKRGDEFARLWIKQAHDATQQPSHPGDMTHA